MAIISAMAERKRLLSIDEPLSDDRVETTRFGSTRTLLEHEIVVFNPARVISAYPTGRRYEDAPTLTDDGSAAFMRDRERRTREIRDYLGLGRLLVVLLPEPKRFFVATGQTLNEGTAAKPRLKRLVQGESLEGLVPVDSGLVAASGEGFRLLAGDPFASFWRAAGEQFHYVSYMRQPPGTPLLAIKGAEAVVASVTEAHGGTLVLLPQRYEFSSTIRQRKGESDEAFEERFERAQQKVDKDVAAVFVDALLELARELRGSPDEGLPVWAGRFLLPREKEAIDAVNQADEKASAALEAAEAARHARLKIERQKVLVTGTGTQLELAVDAALTELGCTVESGEAGRTDRIVRWKDIVAVIEIKGLGKSAGEKDAAQLEKWVSQYTLEHGRVPKGILIVNAWRGIPLDERNQDAFPPQMLPYAIGREQCLATTSQVLTAQVTASRKRDKDQFLEALFTATGVLEGWNWEDALTQVIEVESATEA